MPALPKLPTWAKVLLAVGAVGALVVGALGYAAVHFLMGAVAHTDIVLVDTETGKTTPLGLEDGTNAAPAVAPDGSRIAFVHFQMDANPRVTSLRVYDMASHATRTVATAPFLGSPSWDPSGKRLMVVMDQGGQRDLWIREADGSGETRVTQDAAAEDEPLWSPDGQWVLFRQEVKGTHEVFLVPAAGGAKRQLTHGSGTFTEPKHAVWLADGSGVAFVSFLKLQLVDLEGQPIQTIDLTGLNNVGALASMPNDPDTLLLMARPADAAASLGLDLYRVSRKAARFSSWKSGWGVTDTGLTVSPDGRTLAVARPK